MNDLIEALTILARYSTDTYAPTHCEHDILICVAAATDGVTPEDVDRLDALGWFVGGEEYGGPFWCSYRFGSA